MLAFVLKSLWARRRRISGAALAVVIGVSFLTATTVLGDAMTAGIGELTEESFAGTDLRVRNETSIGTYDERVRATIPESLLADLEGLDEVERAIPVIVGPAVIERVDGSQIGGGGPPSTALNWIESDRSPYVLVSGRAPAGAHEVVIERGVADAGELAVGAVTAVRTPNRLAVTVVGIAELRSGRSLGGVLLTWFDTDTAQGLLVGEGELGAIDILRADGSTDSELAGAVATVLPDGLEVMTPQELIDEANAQVDADFLGFFKTFLTAFAVIALLVAAFSIQNTFAILVAQRTRESALLRALGSSRRQILTSITAEALVLGVVAAALGVGLGVGLAAGLNALLEAVDVGVPTSGLGASTAVILTGLLVGTAITVASSVMPAIRASRIAPIAAMRDVAVDTSGRSWLRAMIGLLVLAAGVSTVVLATEVGDAPFEVAGVGSLLTFGGFVLLGPTVGRLAASLIGAPIAVLRGTSGKLARRNAMRNPKRTAGTASALLIGTAVVALFASLATSIKTSFDDLLAESFGGDLVVSPEGFSGALLSPNLAGEVSELPEVAAVAPLSWPSALVDGRNDEPLATQFAALVEVAELDVVQGDLGSIGRNGTALAQTYAADHGLGLGDTMTLEFIDGATEIVTVGAIYAQENLFGEMLISDDLWATHTMTVEHLVVMIALADGVDLSDGRVAVDSVVERYGQPRLEDSDQYLASQAATIDQMLGVVYALLGLAVVIALIGIANTLSLSLHERTRELGLLRAVGQSRRALRSTVRWESIIVAVFGTFGGITLGTFLCWGLVRAINATEGFGTFAPSYAALAVILGVSVVAGVVAAARPARRAAKRDVLEAIATD